VTAPQPDTRTPGQVMWEVFCGEPGHRWEDVQPHTKEMLEVEAAAVIAHDAAQRAARGELVVPRMHVETLISVAEEFNPRPTRQTRSELQAALAAPTPKETDR
jgi:hypothetical protein